MNLTLYFEGEVAGIWLNDPVLSSALCVCRPPAHPVPGHSHRPAGSRLTASSAHLNTGHLGLKGTPKNLKSVFIPECSFPFLFSVGWCGMLSDPLALDLPCSQQRALLLYLIPAGLPGKPTYLALLGWFYHVLWGGGFFVCSKIYLKIWDVTNWILLSCENWYMEF